jgi:hypothetical protein
MGTIEQSLTSFAATRLSAVERRVSPDQAWRVDSVDASLALPDTWITLRLEADRLAPGSHSGVGSVQHWGYSFGAQVLDLAYTGLTSGIASQPLLACLKELLRPVIIETLRNAFRTA